jgi:hypothetical protein
MAIRFESNAPDAAKPKVVAKPAPVAHEPIEDVAPAPIKSSKKAKRKAKDLLGDVDSEASKG